MRIGLLPIVALVAIVLLALAAWGAAGALRGRGRGSGFPARHAAVMMTCGTLLWLVLSMVFMVLASLGHSAHPLRDAWPQCAAGFLVLVAGPAALLAWLAVRRRR